MRTLVDLVLGPEHRRGHGALYGGLSQGRIEASRLRRALVGMPLPKAADGRLVLAVELRHARPPSTDLRRPWEMPAGTEQTGIRPRPQRSSETAREDRVTSWCTETVPPTTRWARNPTELDKRQDQYLFLILAVPGATHSRSITSSCYSSVRSTPVFECIRWSPSPTRSLRRPGSVTPVLMPKFHVILDRVEFDLLRCCALAGPSKFPGCLGYWSAAS